MLNSCTCPGGLVAVHHCDPSGFAEDLGDWGFFCSALSLHSLGPCERSRLLLSELLVPEQVYIAPTEALTEEVV